MPDRLISEEAAVRAVDFLDELLDRRRHVFPAKIWLADGAYRSGFSPPEDVLRYSITCFLGLRAARRWLSARRLWLDRADEHIESFVHRHSSAVQRPSDLGLLLLLTAADDDLAQHSARAMQRLRRMLASAAPRALDVQDLSWMLWGAATAARRRLPGAENLATSVYDRLAGSVVRETGLPQHRPVRWRRHLVSFGGISYYLRALHEFSRLSTEPAAGDLFLRGLETTVRAQQPDGAWPWLFSAASGRALERYPVFTVHQVGMAPLFLVPALAAGLAPAGAALTRGVAWAAGANELGSSMLVDAPAFMYRSLHRRELAPRPERYVRALIRGRRADTPHAASARRLVVDRYSHAYEWGWLLFAYAELADLSRADHQQNRPEVLIDGRA